MRSSVSRLHSFWLRTQLKGIYKALQGTTISLDMTATVPGNDYSITVTWRKLHPCTATDSAMYAPSSLMEYLITGLDEGSTYNITVTVTNEAGNNSSSPVIATTVEAGKTDIFTQLIIAIFLIFSSLCSS